jgi:Rieske Fe-S protein
MAMTSLWLADRIDRPTPPDPLVEADHSADVAVVGAGLTGLVTAVLLARAGKDVLVLQGGNDADESWECPLHGSRFAPDGTLLEGPATRNLTAAQ